MDAIFIGFTFISFFIGLVVAAVLRFQQVVAIAGGSQSTTFVVAFIAIVCGVLLGYGLALLDLFARATWKKFVYGSVLGLIVFFGFFAIEDAISQRKLYSEPQAASFAEVSGHCGVYIGRAIVKAYHWTVNPSLDGILNDFEMGNRCRINHFLRLAKRDQLLCKPNEDPIQCRVRWMPAFAEHGYWNGGVRQMFLDEIDRVYRESQSPGSTLKINPESMIAYGLKDYELDSARPSVVKQAGLEEEFTDEYLYYKQADDLQNTILTRDVFDLVSRATHHDSGSLKESPQVEKFKEAQKDVSFKTEKIKELESDLAALKKKIDF
jgi:hypothetical protein